MADLVNFRPRPGVRINLHIADIYDVMTQPEVLGSFNIKELEGLICLLEQEKSLRLSSKE